MQSTTVEISSLRSWSIGKAVAWTMALSVAVVGFLFWLIYFNPASGRMNDVVRRLPAVNATLNSLSTVFLVAGYVAIRRGEQRRHMKFMFAALASSTLFFISYVVYHTFKGHTPFTGQGAIEPIYFFVLISHIVLSGIAVPMILLSFFTSLAGRFAIHRRLSRYTFPIWLYVSVTGVLVFLMLRFFST